MLKRFFLFLLIIILLAGCAPAATTVSTPTQQASSPVERPTAGPTSPTEPAEVSEVEPATTAPATTLTVPTPSPDAGVIVGTIFSTKMNGPLPNMGVYLGEYMYMTPGPDYLVTIRQESSLHTFTDSQGRFVFENVPPGKYPILLWTPFSSHVIPDEKHEKELVVEITAGKVTDLDLIEVEWP
jgi:hypothetical protein